MLYMSFFEKFGKSALELKSIRCLTVTGILIALDVVLKLVSIKVSDSLKITFAYVALATIGMLFGPTVGFLAGVITDVIGYFLSPEGGFSPLFTLIEALGAMIYGIFLYDIRPLNLKRALSKDDVGNSLLNELLISLGAGVLLGAVFGGLCFLVNTVASGTVSDDKNVIKIIDALSDPSLIYVGILIGFLYGSFFTFVIRASNVNKGEFGKSVKIVLSKVVVVVVCNLIMTPVAMVISGYMTMESMIAAYPLRLVKNMIQCPVDCIILLMILFPILSAYKKIFPNTAARKKTTEQGRETQ